MTNPWGVRAGLRSGWRGWRGWREKNGGRSLKGDEDWLRSRRRAGPAAVAGAVGGVSRGRAGERKVQSLAGSTATLGGLRRPERGSLRLCRRG